MKANTCNCKRCKLTDALTVLFRTAPPAVTQQIKLTAIRTEAILMRAQLGDYRRRLLDVARRIA